MYDILSRQVCGGVGGNHRPAPPSPPMAHPRNPPPQGASPRSPSRGVTLRGPHPTEPHHGAPGLRGLTPRGSRCAAGRARPASTKFRPRFRHRNASAPRPRSQGEGPPGITHPRITRRPLPTVSSRARTSPTPGPPAQRSFRARRSPRRCERRPLSPRAHKA